MTLDTIKRQARREAWKNDSYNPFAKMNRTSTWSQPSRPAGAERDVERGDGVNLGHVLTEPIPESPTRNGSQNEETENESKPEEEEGRGAENSNNSRPSDPESETTIVDRASTRPRSNEEKARKRFLSRFSKDKALESPVDAEEEKPKKNPWYKGKDVPHAPFTVRNQIQATIFNSYINILLLAAPIGIGLNYAGISGTVVFVVNFIAIIPLAGLLSFATEEIALHLGENLGGLLNASLG
jgi:Ca2+:H+ antiporter